MDRGTWWATVYGVANWIFVSEDENCKGKVMGRISHLLGQVDRNSTWQSLFFLTFCPKVTSLPLVCYLIDVWSFWVHVSSGYEPAWSTLFRSPLEQQLMETCFPFLQISLEPRGPRDWETGRKKEEGNLDSAFSLVNLLEVIQPP